MKIANNNIGDAQSLPKGYKQTEVGVIPEDWELFKFKEIGDAIIGLTYSPSNVSSVGRLVHRSSNIQDNSLAYDDNVYVNCSIPEKLILRENDILICVRNGSRNLIGKAAIIKGKSIGETFGAFMSVFRPNLYPSLIYQYFISNIVQNQINASLGATINQITNKTLNSFITPFPPTLKEQKAIATALSDVDELITSLDQLITKKKAIKQGAMQELLTPPKKGGKRLPGFDGEWVEKRLGDCLSYEQPTKYLVSNSDYEGQSQIPVLTAGKSFILGYTDEKNGIYHDLPVVIFDDFTTSNHIVDFNFKVKSSAMKMLKPVSNEYDLYFIYSVMNQINFPLGDDHKRRWIAEYSNIDIFIPDFKEQKAIAKIFSDMDAEIDALEAKKAKYQYVKQGMMQELLTGKIRLV